MGDHKRTKNKRRAPFCFLNMCELLYIIFFFDNNYLGFQLYIRGVPLYIFFCRVTKTRPLRFFVTHPISSRAFSFVFLFYSYHMNIHKHTPTHTHRHHFSILIIFDFFSHITFFVAYEIKFRVYVSVYPCT